MRHLALAALVSFALASALVAGCTDENGPSSGASGSGPSGSGSQAVSCSLTPTDEVRSSLGLPTLGDPTERAKVVDTVTVCDYADGANPTAVIVRYEVDVDADGWAATKKNFVDNGQAITPVPMLGDEAFYSQIGAMTKTTTLVAKKGSRNVTIVSIVELPKIEDLARKTLLRL
ncbi:hypothetical protein [Sorangium sp. So ce1099]|uniref:hypothetical protein n=1 Tax=Sorangium sp. So ce1099 TaxID=3133331 RepID=UPI003F62D2C3